MESPLTNEQLAHFKSLLEQEAKRITEELASFTSKEGGENSAQYVDFGTEEDDNAEEYRQHEVNLSLEKKLEEELAEVKHALERIESGVYGICEKSGQPIAIKRLEAYPAARTSIEHAE